MTTTAPAGLRLARFQRRVVLSGVMIYENRHRECAAWPDLEAWLTYIKVGNRRPRTLEAYERYNARLLLLYPDKKFAEFDDGNLLHHLSFYSALSRHIVKAPLNQWFKWGYRTRRLTWNPADLLPDVRYRPTRDISVFTPIEEASLRTLPHPDGLLMTVLLETGLRNQEARSLTVKRVAFDTQELLVKEGAKGGRERLVPLTRTAAGAFHELILADGLGPDDHFWCSHPGGGHRTKRDTPVVTSTFQNWWKDSLRKAKVTYRKPHTTRHSFATRWLDTDLPESDVQDALGHESIRTTRDVYHHRNRAKAGDRMRAIEADAPDIEHSSSSISERVSGA